MKEYDLYLFDFDNTLYDTSEAINKILMNGLSRIGIEYDASMFTRYQGMNTEDILGQFPIDPKDREKCERGMNEIINSEIYLNASPFPGAAETLRTLKSFGKHIGIVSGKKRYKIENLLSADGLRSIPEIIIGYDETERHKPYPDPIEAAFAHFDVEKSRTVFVGDSPNDSGAAEAFGIDVAIVNRHDALCTDGIPCTYEIESLSELLDWSDQS